VALAESIAAARTNGVRTLTAEILAAEAGIHQAVADKSEGLSVDMFDTEGFEASRPPEFHRQQAAEKRARAMAALQTADTQNLDPLPRTSSRDMWFGGHYFVHDDTSPWKEPDTEFNWFPGRSMAFEQHMLDLGLDVMQITAPLFSWKNHEPEDDQFDFSTARHYLQSTQDMNIFVRFNAFEGRSGARDLPEWFEKRFQGDYEFIDHEGKTWMKHTMSVTPQPSRFVPESPWREEMQEFTEEVSKFASQYTNIIYACFSPEQMFWGESVPYTPAFVDGFTIWLQEKYDSIEHLNAAWSGSFSSFEEVYPPNVRRRAARAYEWEKETEAKNSPQAIYDYHTYAEDAMVEFEREKSAWIRGHIPEEVAMFGGKGPELYFNAHAEFARAGLNLWKSRGNDRHMSNADMYSSSPADWAINTNMAVSINGHGSFALEYNSSDRVGHDVHRSMDAETFRQCMWVGIGHGMKGGAFWGLRRLPPIQWSLTYASLDENNLPLDVGVELIRLNNQTRLISEVMAGALPPMDDLALYFPHETFNQKYLFRDEFAWSVELNGLFELLDRSGYSVRFISDENIEEIEDFPVVIMPYSPMVPEKSQQALSSYVASGGHLVAFGAPAKVDHLNQAYGTWPPEPLAKTFGATVSGKNDQAGTISSDNMPLLHIADEYVLSTETLGMRVSAESKPFVQRDTYKPLRFGIDTSGAVALASWQDGAPAVVSNLFEEGRAALAGFLPGTEYMSGDSSKRHDLKTWIKTLLEIEPTLHPENPEVQCSVLKNDKGSFLFLVNLTDSEQLGVVGLNMEKFPAVNEGAHFDLLEQHPASFSDGKMKTMMQPAQAVVYFFPKN
jgi:beta-galactosidase GanA